ncbi:YrrS family protein [Halobacillus kuroshimensis]|uniref:YrrS family protein n=1 Tax=Halobacillus kuroshimensis TaxID=302481 RepID=A0ABS3DZD3_9BACI|nr:YrrS family protein [Halobacillus kuroshimensis]MBN8236718.1 YrrS family protein [Halobacillus kuroshimensis]
MADKHTSESRTGRFEKKRQWTKRLPWLAGAAGVFAVLLISLMLFNGNDQTGQAQNPEEEQQEDTAKDETQEEQEKEAEKEPEEEADPDKTSVSLEGFEELEPIKKEEGLQIEESDDPNVESVVTKDWPVVPTEMDTNGSHSISYNKGTQDYKELQEAVRSAVNLSKDNIIYWWIGNDGGPQRAVATVSDKSETGYLRVHVQWVDNEGYKPVKLEVLKEKVVER